MPPRLFVTLAVLAGGLGMGPAQRAGPPVSNQATPSFTARSDLVVLQVTVEDRARRDITGLTADAFSVLEDGVPQAIAFFTAQDAPVTIGLLVDSSGSMSGVRDLVAAAAGTFVGTSNPQDEVFALTFNDDVRAVLPAGEPFTSDPATLRSAVRAALAARGRTALHDAVLRGLQYLAAGRYERQVLVVISDGGDNASTATFDQVLERSQVASALIYTIVVRDPLDGDANPRRLKRLATATGGEAFEPQDIASVPDVLAHIARDIRHMYTIGYAPSPDKGPGLRRIRVRVSADGRGALRVRTRQGYVVEKGKGP